MVEAIAFRLAAIRALFSRTLARGSLLIALLCVTVMMGYRGFTLYFEHCQASLDKCDARYAERSPFDRFYLCLQLFTLESGPVPADGIWPLEVARLSAPLLSAWTAVETLLMLFGEQFQLLRLRFLKNHVIVCGYGRKGRLLVDALRHQGETVVVIDLAPDGRLASHCRDQGARMLPGDARDDGLLRLAGIGGAREIFCLLGDDGANAQVAMRARKLHAGCLTCYLHFDDTELVRWLHELEFNQSHGAFHLSLCNLHEIGARDLLNTYPPFAETGAGAVLLVGFGRTGESVLREIVRRRAALPNNPAPLPVTVIDRDADRRLAAIACDCRALAELCALESLAWSCDGADFRSGKVLFDNDEFRFQRIYVCLESDVEGLSVALFLRSPAHDHGVEVVLAQSSAATSLAVLLTGEEAMHLAGLAVFPLLERALRPDLLRLDPREVLARRIHAEYLADKQQDGADPGSDPAMAPWETLPESLRQSNRAQADHIGAKLAEIGCEVVRAHGWRPTSFAFMAEEVERLARMEHDRWMRERLEDGWSYGEKKDLACKQSPYLVSWEALSEAIRDYDRNPVRRIPLLLAGAGLAIRRIGSQSGNSGSGSHPAV